MSDRIAVMSAGELQQLGAPRDIYERPRNRFVADFIGDTNLLAVTVETVRAGQAICRLGAAHRLACEAADGIREGDRVHLSIRPERLFISATPASDTALDATVAENIFIGTDISTHLVLDDGTRLTVRSSNSDRGNKRVFDAGAAACVNLEPGAARLLVD